MGGVKGLIGKEKGIACVCVPVTWLSQKLGVYERTNFSFKPEAEGLRTDQGKVWLLLRPCLQRETEPTTRIGLVNSIDRDGSRPGKGDYTCNWHLPS
jgi:hypothetical protein